MQVRGYADRGGDDEDVLDDVLTFEGRYEESRPGSSGNDEKRHDSGDHMQEEEWDHHALGSTDEEEDTDETFEETKQHHECRERHERDSVLKKRFHQRAGRRKIDDFEDAEPEEYSE